MKHIVTRLLHVTTKLRIRPSPFGVHVMAQEPKEAEEGTLVVVEAAWDVVDRFNDDNGRARWTYPGCSNKLYGLNTLIATIRPNF